MKLSKLSAATIIALSIPLIASAQQFPVKPITVIIPASPGGGTDTFGRKIAEEAQNQLNQPLIVENRGGGSGTIGLGQVTRAKPDGYTVGFVWNSPLTSVPHSLNVPYKNTDYSALMSIGFSSYVICAAPNFPANNGKELIELIRANPEKYTIGNDGVGGTMQLASERIFSKAGVKVRQIPFKGAGDTAKNFLGGHIDLYGGSITAIQPHVNAGKAKCLLLTSAEKNSALPQASSLTDIGMPGEETVLWWGLVVPADTPQAVKDQLEMTFMKAASSASMKEAMAKQGAVNRPRGAVDTNKLIASEYAALEQVAKSIGLEKK
jgi:tripartite-type tricarboxylate transporter receptor subunit TctC